MIKVVLDTNVLISATLSQKGKPAQILMLAREGKIELLFSTATTKELWDVLHYQRIKARLEKLKIPLSLAEEFLKGLVKASTLVLVNMEVDVIKDDPSDNVFLACAIEGQANFIISGDNHIKALEHYQEIQIMDPAEFLELMESSPHAA
jgi:putative PIN family toxin of toxin-antitoxin system